MISSDHSTLNHVLQGKEIVSETIGALDFIIMGEI